MAEKGVQVSATVPKEWDRKLEDHRWTVRMTKTQVVRTAVQEYMVRNGLLESETKHLMPENYLESNLAAVREQIDGPQHTA